MSMDLTAGPDLSGLIDATELHRYAEAMLIHLVADGTIPKPQPGVTDVPGYWLAPAIDALVQIMAGEDALEALTRAARHDEARTALFLCLALALAGLGDRVHASWLATAFGDLSADRPVTPGQRAVWVAAARGAYGPAGKIFVLRRLDAVATPHESEPERWLKALLPGEPKVVIPPSLLDFPELAEIPALGVPAYAADRLARLRARCTEITSPRKPEPAPASQAGGRKGVAMWPETEPLDVLRSLINPKAQPGPLSSLTGHLLEDLQPGADPNLAALALHVAAPVVRRAAEELADATRAVPPAEVTVPIMGHPIVLRPDGPDPASIEEAERQIRSQALPPDPYPWLPQALIGISVVVLGLSFAISILLAVGSLVLAGTGGILLWRRKQREQAEAQFIDGQLSELRELADRAVFALHEYARESAKRSEAAGRDLAELSRLLRRGPRAA